MMARKRLEDYATEAQLQALIVNYLRMHGWRVLVTDAGEAARSSRTRHRRGLVSPGTPDLTILRDGMGAMIEVKTKRGRVSKTQAAEHERLRELGVPVCVAKSLEDVELFLRGIEEECRARTT